MPKQPKQPGVGKGNWTRRERTVKCQKCGHDFSRVRSNVTWCEKCKAKERKQKWRERGAATVGHNPNLGEPLSDTAYRAIYDIVPVGEHPRGDTTQYGVGSGRYSRLYWVYECRACGVPFNTWKHYSEPFSVGGLAEVGDGLVDWDRWRQLHDTPICRKCGNRVWAKEDRARRINKKYDDYVDRLVRVGL